MKTRFLALLFMTFLLGACSSSPHISRPVNIMVLVDDSSSGALPAGHRASKTLVNGLSDFLINEGISVYDDVVLELDDFGGNRLVTNKVRLLERVRNYRKANIDYAVIVTLDASVRDMGSSQRVSTRVYGQTINVNSGKVAGSFSDTGTKIRASTDCSRACLSRKLSDSADSTVGNVAVQIVSHFPSFEQPPKTSPRKPSEDFAFSKDYILIFDGFERRELQKIEGYLEIFSGFEDLQYSFSRRQYAEIWYQSSISKSKLSRNLNRMMGELNKEAVIRFELDTVVIRKLTIKERKPKFDLDGWE